MRISRTRAMAGGLVLIACTQYFIAEAIAAAAWRDPAYSYARNFISDLGMPRCPQPLDGRIICSPLHGVMNASFLLEGALVILALVLLLPMLPGRAWRTVVTGFFVMHAVGVMTVGIWPAAEMASGGASLHVVGALMAILGGNIAVAAVGLAFGRSGAPRWFPIGSFGLGLFGLCGAIALSSTRVLPPGIFERIAVDGISVWKIATGSILAIALSRGDLDVTTGGEARVSNRA